jgi:hypothetical protein
MIVWLAPGAIAALALLAGPVIVHLLARRHARRVVFPASHFVRPVQAAAVRLRRPTDLLLMMLRLAIVGAAVAAAAGPVVLTSQRLSQWDARVSRAIVVDTSRSMPSAEAASALAAKETEGAFRAQRIEAGDLPGALERAAGWLATVPPSRLEVVIISDFQQGSIDREALDALPSTVGIRFIRAGGPPASRSATLTPIDYWRGARWTGSLAVDGRGVASAWTRESGGTAPQAEAVPSWLTVAAPAADATAADRAVRAAASFGVPAGDDNRRAVVIFAGGEVSGAAQPVREPWMADAALALRDSGLLRETGVDVTVEDRAGRLAVRVPIAASSPSAPAVIRAVALSLRPAAIADSELETQVIPDSDLAQWRRDASPLAGPGGVSTLARTLRDTADGEGQGRWLWALALVLLGVEGWARRVRRTPVAQEAHADAA